MVTGEVSASTWQGKRPGAVEPGRGSETLHSCTSPRRPLTLTTLHPCLLPTFLFILLTAFHPLKHCSAPALHLLTGFCGPHGRER